MSALLNALEKAATKKADSLKKAHVTPIPKLKIRQKIQPAQAQENNHNHNDNHNLRKSPSNSPQSPSPLQNSSQLAKFLTQTQHVSHKTPSAAWTSGLILSLCILIFSLLAKNAAIDPSLSTNKTESKIAEHQSSVKNQQVAFSQETFNNIQPKVQSKTQPSAQPNKQPNTQPKNETLTKTKAIEETPPTNNTLTRTENQVVIERVDKPIEQPIKKPFSLTKISTKKAKTATNNAFENTNLLIVQGYYQLAFESLSEHLKQYPKDLTGIDTLIRLANQVHPQKMSTLIQDLIPFHPNHSLLLFTQGNLFAKQSNWTAANASFLEALKINPNNPDILFNIGVSFEHLKQYKPAYLHYKKALQFSQKQPASFTHEVLQLRLDQLRHRF